MTKTIPVDYEAWEAITKRYKYPEGEVEPAVARLPVPGGWIYRMDCRIDGRPGGHEAGWRFVFVPTPAEGVQ